VNYPKTIVIVVNIDKTEVVWLGANRLERLDTINMSNHSIKLRDSIIAFSSNLDWSNHIKNVMNKGKG